MLGGARGGRDAWWEVGDRNRSVDCGIRRLEEDQEIWGCRDVFASYRAGSINIQFIYNEGNCVPRSFICDTT